MSLRSHTLQSLDLAPDLTERVYAAIEAAITAGDLAPGVRLTQEELAEKLAVSRQPVLQALRLLKRDGFVVDAPSKGKALGARGVMVSPLDPAVIRQVYQVRAALDALAARLAAQAKARLPASLVEAGRRAATASGISHMIEADVAFHDAIYIASGNPFIAEAARRHWHPIRRAMGAVLQSIEDRESVWDEHEAILKAISRGDAVRAERLMREHGEIAGGLLADRIESQQQIDTARASASPVPPSTETLKRHNGAPA